MLTHADIPSNATPEISTDGAGGVPNRQWYAAWVTYRTEKAVRDSLLRQGIEAYVATKHEIHIWRREERRVIEHVLIPSVVFVRITENERIKILKQPNVKSFMLNPAGKASELGRKPFAVISESEMQLLQSMLAQEDSEVAFASSGFSVGDYVKVLGFENGEQIAQIIHLPGNKSTYVGVRVAFLGCAYMQVSPKRIVKIKQQ